ncbi:MAG: DUF748 domain-containing protein [Alphaproteobacteria bacterium]|uniref:DUF748 domain-containing protein n=1 Tax=Candidatus Nitrobium versatile TaxID=2884831 RepID=A0A953M233_9BACT|nr:DUF748 domain-containing protein [Candidatus Nitrobium versatile]
MEFFRRKHRTAAALALSGILLFTLLFFAGLFTLKGKILGMLSGETSSRIGHPVVIGDFSLAFPFSLSLHRITVRDPDNKGTLLRIGTLTVSPDIPELLRGEVRVKAIDLSAPELLLKKNHRGEWNISAALKDFLSRKSDRTYRVESFSIQSGRISLSLDAASRGAPLTINEIRLLLNDISSRPDMRTSFRGSFTWENAGSFTFEGWSYLRKTGKDFSLALHTPRLAPSFLKEFLARYGVDAHTVSFAAELKAEGNTTHEIRLTSEVQAERDVALPFFRAPLRDTLLLANARFNVPGDTLILDRLLLSSGNDVAVRAEGSVRNISGKPFYNATMKIGKIDLAALSLPGGVRAAGSITSDSLLISGGSGIRPRITGNVRLDGGTIRSEKIESERIDAQVTFSSPSRLSLSARGIRFGNSRLSRLSLGSALEYGDRTLTLHDAELLTDSLKASVKRMTGTFPEKKGTILLAAKGVDAKKDDGKIAVGKGDLSLALKNLSPSPSGDFTFSASTLVFQDFGQGSGQGFAAGPLSGSGLFDGEGFSLAVPRAEVLKGRMQLSVSGKTAGGPFPLTLRARVEGIDPGPLLQALKIPYLLSTGGTRASFEGTFSSFRSLEGHMEVESSALSLKGKTGGQRSLTGVSLRAKAAFKGTGAEVSGTAAVKNLSASFSGTIEDFMDSGRTLTATVHLPGTKAADMREALWDIFPDRLLYAGLDGSLASEVSLRYGRDGLVLRGQVTARDLVLTGENNEFTVGPVQGTLPLVYGGTPETGKTAAEFPAFEKAAFDSLVSRYGQRFAGEGFSRITLGSFRYGFDLLQDITLWVRPEGGILNIGRFSATIFGGKFYGAALVDLSGGLSYRAGFLVKGLSLTSLGNTITPVKGYISGKVDGTGTLKGTGASLARLIGKADFWTYREGREKMVISKEFLRKVGGPSLRAYLTDRSYDRGVMSLYLQNGDVVFRELEISNTNLLGIRDLSVQVAPLNNRIALDHLLWTLVEAAQRAKENQ